MTFLLIALGVAFLSLVLVAGTAVRQRVRYRALVKDLLRPDPVEAEPLPLEGADDERVEAAARRYAEQRAWQVAMEVARVRQREDAERELMEVAQRYAERRAWQVAMQMAKDRIRH